MSERDPPGIVWAVTASYTIGVLGGNMQPLLIGALIDGLHLDESSAGLLGSIELGGVAVASFVLAPRMGTISRRALILAGAALAICGYLGSALPSSFLALAGGRIVAGIGAGMVLAIGNAAVSACRDPDRVFAQTTIIGTVLITAVLALLPGVIARYTYHGGYAGMGVVAVALAPLLLWIPDKVPAGPAHGHVEANRLGIATVASACLLFFCQSAMWAFAERVAVAAAMDPQQIGLALAGSTLAGLAGAFLANWLGTRAGRTMPLIIGIVATGATMLALVYTGTPTTYTAVLVLNGIAYLFMVPYIMGTAAALDRQGRWAAATIGAATVGAALGPGIAGPVVSAGGYVAVGWLVFVVSLLSAAAITPVARALDQRAELPLAA